ncbi:hypothetical protein N4T43_000001 [Salmonella enterica]|nr:hypothetical protein [Salmonella enterica]
MTGSLFLKNDGRMHFAIANADGNVRMWLYKDKGGDGVRLNNGVDGGGEFVFNKNSEFYSPSHLHAGAAIFGNNGDVYGSVWGNNWLSSWLNNQFAARDNNINARVTSDYVNQTFVRAVRLGPQAFSGALWRDYQLGGGNVVTGFHTDGDWEMEGNDDHVYYRPVQYLVNGTWVTAASV